MTLSQWLVYAVNYASSRGYRITSQSDIQVQMLMPKQRSCLLTGVLLVLGVVPGLVYLAFSTDKALLLTDTGHSIQSNQGGSKFREVSYQSISEGNYKGLIKGRMPPLLAALIAFLFVAILGIVILVNISETPATKEPLDRNPASYILVEDQQFSTYPDDYKNIKIKFDCKVFNILSKSQFQCRLSENNEPVFVITRNEFSGLYEDTNITVFGIGGGTSCGKNAFGAQVCSPLVENAFYVR